MKAIYVLLGVLITPLVHGQDALPSQALAESESPETGRSCVAACEQVFADCENLCRDTSARSHDHTYETPDLPVDACLEACAQDLGLCKRNC